VDQVVVEEIFFQGQAVILHNQVAQETRLQFHLHKVIMEEQEELLIHLNQITGEEVAEEVPMQWGQTLNLDHRFLL
jgi:hypothetical protein